MSPQETAQLYVQLLERCDGVCVVISYIVLDDQILHLLQETHGGNNPWRITGSANETLLAKMLSLRFKLGGARWIKWRLVTRTHHYSSPVVKNSRVQESRALDPRMEVHMIIRRWHGNIAVEHELLFLQMRAVRMRWLDVHECSWMNVRQYFNTCAIRWRMNVSKRVCTTLLVDWHANCLHCSATRLWIVWRRWCCA